MKTNIVKRILCLFVFGSLLTMAGKQYAGVPQYWVYCVNDKIEVAMWDLAQMKVRRGSSNIYLLGEFESYSSALDYAKRFGGNGACCGEK